MRLWEVARVLRMRGGGVAKKEAGDVHHVPRSWSIPCHDSRSLGPVLCVGTRYGSVKRIGNEGGDFLV